jgi:hypothetical protein
MIRMRRREMVPRCHTFRFGSGCLPLADFRSGHREIWEADKSQSLDRVGHPEEPHDIQRSETPLTPKGVRGV